MDEEKSTQAETAREFPKRRGPEPLTIIILIMGLAAVLGSWFFPKTTQLNSSLFDSDQIIEQAEQVVLLVNAGDGEALAEMSTDTLRSALEQGVIESAKQQLEVDWDAFDLFTSSYVGQQEQAGTFFAVVELTALYGERTVTYTISFDTEGRLAGIYMK